MRVTESRLLEMATRSVSVAREKAGEATNALASGLRVQRPSDDPVAWAQGARAKSALDAWAARGAAAERAKDRLAESEQQLGAITDLLLNARDLTVQSSSATYGRDEQAAAAGAIRTLAADIKARMNARSGLDGEYLFAGDRGDQAPFDATDTYVGGTTPRALELAPGAAVDISVAGTVFTAANGVDVLDVLETIALALEAGDGAAASAELDNLDAASTQVNNARSRVGYGVLAIEDAGEARANLELTLREIGARLIESDPIEAATRLAQAQTTFQASGAMAQQIIAMLQRG